LLQDLGVSSKTLRNASESDFEVIRYILSDCFNIFDLGHLQRVSGEEHTFLVYPEKDVKLNTRAVAKMLYLATGAAASFPYTPPDFADYKDFIDDPTPEKARSLCSFQRAPTASYHLLRVFYAILGLFEEEKISDILTHKSSDLLERRGKYVLHGTYSKHGGYPTNNRD
jgi:hypothetical protein